MQCAKDDFDHGVELLHVLIVLVAHFRSFAIDDHEQIDQSSHGVLFAQLRNDRRRESQVFDQTHGRFDRSPVFFQALVSKQLHDNADAIRFPYRFSRFVLQIVTRSDMSKCAQLEQNPSLDGSRNTRNLPPLRSNHPCRPCSSSVFASAFARRSTSPVDSYSFDCRPLDYSRCPTSTAPTDDHR